jgi:hypothetical protein
MYAQVRKGSSSVVRRPRLRRRAGVRGRLQPLFRPAHHERPCRHAMGIRRAAELVRAQMGGVVVERRPSAGRSLSYLAGSYLHSAACSRRSSWNSDHVSDGGCGARFYVEGGGTVGRQIFD